CRFSNAAYSRYSRPAVATRPRATMNPDVAWEVWAGERARRVEVALDVVLPQATEAPLALHEAMRYAVLGGGKRIRALLAYAAGSRGMAGGQALDLAHIGRSMSQPELELMHRLKTGALLHAAARLGGHCGRPLGAVELDALDRFASALGLAFQVVDDVLDVEG